MQDLEPKDKIHEKWAVFEAIGPKPAIPERYADELVSTFNLLLKIQKERKFPDFGTWEWPEGIRIAMIRAEVDEGSFVANAWTAAHHSLLTELERLAVAKVLFAHSEIWPATNYDASRLTLLLRDISKWSKSMSLMDYPIRFSTNKAWARLLVDSVA
jgi:hypothetical protein